MVFHTNPFSVGVTGEVVSEIQPTQPRASALRMVILQEEHYTIQ